MSLNCEVASKQDIDSSIRPDTLQKTCRHGAPIIVQHSAFLMTQTQHLNDTLPRHRQLGVFARYHVQGTNARSRQRYCSCKPHAYTSKPRSSLQ